MAKAENKRVHVMLTERQYEKVQKLSDTTGYSISELMRRAVDSYLAATAKNKNGQV
jgi:metal-responsive CopG/Arc/MetJ family transcriptional regulator